MKKLDTSFGSGESQEPYPLPCLDLITLITYQYQFSFLLFVCLACLWASLYLYLYLRLTYPSRHHLTARLLAYQHLGLGIKSYIMNKPLLSRLTSCVTASYARGIQYGLSVRVSLLLRGLNNSKLYH
jgi:hypothetical protein